MAIPGKIIIYSTHPFEMIIQRCYSVFGVAVEQDYFCVFGENFLWYAFWQLMRSHNPWAGYFFNYFIADEFKQGRLKRKFLR